MNRGRLAVWWLLSSAAVAGASAWGVLHWHVMHEHKTAPGPSHPAALMDSEERFHAWVHGNLKLTNAQHAALDAAENASAARRQELRESMRTANAALCAAILKDGTQSPAVQTALDQLASSQAALQKATLSHLFEMAAHLDATDRAKLVQWTHDSLQPHP